MGDRGREWIDGGGGLKPDLCASVEGRGEGIKQGKVGVGVGVGEQRLS